jgi:hemerythrin superfamily protein
MPSRSTSRANSNVRTQILGDLKEDHKRVKKAYRDFQKLDAQEDPESCEALVLQVLDELSMHAAIEEELLYPAAREAIADEHLVDEAEVEHESMHALIDQLRQMSPDDDKYAARFTVLCEYVLHHVKEEEGEMFPQLERARLDWESLATEMNERRAEMSGGKADAQGSEQDEDDQTEGAEDAAGARSTARGTERNG